MNTDSLQQRFLKIRSNKAFELFVVFIIVFSALVIGAKTYDIPPNVLLLVSWLDWLITTIFLVEIIVRYLGEEKKSDFFKQPWNVFDTIIVVVSLIPADSTDMALVGRLIRIFRVLRMVSIIPELRLLLNSLVKAMPQLGYVMLLMFIIFYIYAAIGATFFAPINEVLWGDITRALLTLFRVMTFEDWTDVMYETMTEYPFSWFYYITFIFFTAFAFLNMVIGIIVGVLEDEHAKERAAQAEEDGKVTLEDLAKQVEELKTIIVQQQKT